MLDWQIEARPLPLRYTWKISRNASTTKTNCFVTVSDGKGQGMGEAAPNIRYNETPESLTDQFGLLKEAGLGQVKNMAGLQEILNQAKPANALRFAVESAYVHFLCRQQGVSVSQFLGIPAAGKIGSMYSLPIMDPAEIAGFIRDNNLGRFKSLKIKVNQELGHDLISRVWGVYNGPLIIDGNEAWTDPDELLHFLEPFKNLPVEFIEQPMPAGLAGEYKHLKRHSPFDLFADESVTDHADFNELQHQFHGVNMKLMKAGGYLNGLEILNQTRQFGLKSMIGCMVETSLGIWSAMQLAHDVSYADLDGFLILADEPFGLVKEENGLLEAEELGI